MPFPSPGDLPNPGIESGSPVLQADSLVTEHIAVISWAPSIHMIILHSINSHQLYAICLGRVPGVTLENKIMDKGPFLKEFIV